MELRSLLRIQVRKQHYFLNRFHYYLASQLVENVQQLRQQGQTHKDVRADGASLWQQYLGRQLLLPDESPRLILLDGNSRTGKPFVFFL